MRQDIITAILATFLFGSTAFAAGPDEEATISLVFENDFFASDDFNYTNGTKLSYLSGAHEPKGIGKFVADKLFPAETEGATAWHGFGIGQSLYTPEDVLTAAPVPGQHPYAAYLYSEYTAIVAQKNYMTQLTAQVGMVGPSAFGEETQNFVHELLGGDEAQGWDNQIGDELGIAITLDHRHRIGTTLGNRGIALDVIPGWGATVGNVRTDVHAGVTMRLGVNLEYDYGPARVLPGLRGTSYFTSRDGFSWHVFGGFEGRAIAHDIFLDGSFLDGDDITVESRDLVGDAQGGLVLQYGRYQVSYIHVFRSSEFKNSGGSDEFGALAFAMKMGSW